jgi:hypothetical protein
MWTINNYEIVNRQFNFRNGQLISNTLNTGMMSYHVLVLPPLINRNANQTIQN